MTISAISPVYNEEARIESMLRSIMWCDEIIILDKNSTDKTREIASRYTDKILTLPKLEFDPVELQILIDNVNSEWVILVTASDVIHPRLATELRKLIEQNVFPYDVIHVPYRRYVLGLESKLSPWYTEVHPVVFRKHVAIVQKSVHGALAFNTERHYKMSNSTEYCMYHLTHETVDNMMERHLRYWRAEGQLFPPEFPLRKGINAILRAAYDVVFKRKSYLMGWDGIALGLAYLSYSMLRFVYIWEQRQSKAPETYNDIREAIANAWLNEPLAKESHD